MSRTTVKIFFNFRSPYCYLASHRLFERLTAFDSELVWRSLGGWPPARFTISDDACT